jgi:hypothetical protein
LTSTANGGTISPRTESSEPVQTFDTAAVDLKNKKKIAGHASANFFFFEPESKSNAIFAQVVDGRRLTKQSPLHCRANQGLTSS